MGAAQGTVQGSTGSINLQIRGGWGHCDQPHRLCLHPHTTCTHSQGLPTVMLPMPGSPWGGVGGPQGCQTKGHRVWPPPFRPWGLCSFSPEKRIFSCFLPTGTNRNCLNGCIALGTGPFGAEPHAGKGKPRGHFNNKQGELLKCFTASLRQSNLCVYLEKKKLACWCFYCNRGGCFLARLGSRLLYLLVFLPDTGTEQPKSSSRAAAGRVRARQTRREAVDP